MLVSFAVYHAGGIDRWCFNETEYPIDLEYGDEPHCYATDDVNDTAITMANYYEEITYVGASFCSKLS